MLPPKKKKAVVLDIKTTFTSHDCRFGTGEVTADVGCDCIGLPSAAAPKKSWAGPVGKDSKIGCCLCEPSLPATITHQPNAHIQMGTASGHTHAHPHYLPPFLSSSHLQTFSCPHFSNKIRLYFENLTLCLWCTLSKRSYNYIRFNTLFHTLRSALDKE